ncbi:hypothetical protein COCCADRAFT_4714 [Bipolaris zeicola 26-R-13]|uniref:Uncharacterized protein n=1 Tax=Cochliobolus carbonum (strain 26-R-13) TaxID=930089 RepID=W6Y8I1_COCC2|nr:uncharacterized protein COCCADRAFT_4714 [Bipolaris zeicola 26-R-13]EUC33780.1 hypothetical protein COCCADRAFT_4714 [Bipolaris zeicola 26-R-13]
MAKDDLTDAAGAIIAVPPSPEQDHYKREPDYQHELYADLVFRPIGYEIPPTLPLQYRDDGFGELHSWYAQNQHRIASKQVRIPQVQPVYMPYSGFYAVPSHVDTQFPPSQRPETRPRLHPCANLLHSSPEQLMSPLSPVQISPPIQEWPTHNLRMDETARRKREEFLQNEEAKRAKQAQTPASASSMQYNVHPTPSSTYPQNHGKRKSRDEDLQAPSTPPRRYRRLVPGPAPEEPPEPSYPSGTPRVFVSQLPGSGPSYSSSHSIYDPVRAASGEDQSYSPSLGHGSSARRLGLQPRVYAPEPPPRYLIPISSLSHYHATSHVQPPLNQPPPHGPLPSEGTRQPITDKYEAYKWPVWHFELRSGTRFDFAQTYINDWLEQTTFFPQKPKWHCHITTGFIKGGTRFSVLVLHNAANPFQWGPTAETTTTIGVYGRYAHTHEEIHWTTITPWRITQFRANPDFILKEKWDFDMPKASDRRFHRAYWLAANMLPLKGLLNHCIPHEKPHDAPQEGAIDEKFKIKREDLQCCWSNGQMPKEHCEKVWQKVLSEIEGKEMHQLGSDHITVGGTEREYEVD